MTYREEIFKYVRNKYQTIPEYLWAKFPNYAILRHNDNKKWYGAIMDISKDKLGLYGKELVDILNLKLQDPFYREILVKQEGYFVGYHISRGNWLTVLLDGTVPLNDIYSLIDESFVVTSSKKNRKRAPKELMIK